VIQEFDTDYTDANHGHADDAWTNHGHADDARTNHSHANDARTNHGHADDARTNHSHANDARTNKSDPVEPEQCSVELPHGGDNYLTNDLHAHDH
jgi:hypothetical protein